MDQQTLRQHRLNNRLQSLLLVVALAALVGYLGWMLGGLLLSTVGVLLACMVYLVNPQASLRLTLRLYRTSRLSQQQVPELYQVLSELCRRAGIEQLPQLYYMPSYSLNAFAVGSQKDAAIILSEGLLRKLNFEQMVGVLGHELAHIHHNDLQLMGFADTISRVAGGFTLMGVILLILHIPLMILFGEFPPLIPVLLLLLAPYLSILLQLALSRTREFEADRFCSELVGSPQPLIHALKTMETESISIIEQILMPGRRQPEPSLIRTHPATEERIRRLEELQGESGNLFIQPMTDYLKPFPRKESLQRPRWRIWGHWY
ncbi:zinc metalloprotease HtpX [Motiliproteus sp. MSK22-1]|uniref:zinc metalloprotease HtpX n=1 Tax=Motiliproteus sp. MSK22-1 TaxID=1897630 RepID=UPI000977C025|nr:zinc metalloprotease HtpX [Motiliproteus sp. MSK22-1]OMH33793.1 hypothetical protein BGP75_12445 [Motiliproteus sp. MSK22-1]